MSRSESVTMKSQDISLPAKVKVTRQDLIDLKIEDLERQIKDELSDLEEQKQKLYAQSSKLDEKIHNLEHKAFVAVVNEMGLKKSIRQVANSVGKLADTDITLEFGIRTSHQYSPDSVSYALVVKWPRMDPNKLSLRTSIQNICRIRVNALLEKHKSKVSFSNWQVISYYIHEPDAIMIVNMSVPMNKDIQEHHKQLKKIMHELNPIEARIRFLKNEINIYLPKYAAKIKNELVREVLNTTPQGQKVLEHLKDDVNLDLRSLRKAFHGESHA